jgi:hypothetical protein
MALRTSFLDIAQVRLPPFPYLPPSLCRSSPSRRDLSHFPYGVSHGLPRHYTCPVASVGASIPPPSPVSVSFIPLKARSLPLSVRRLTGASSTLHVSGCPNGIVRFPAFLLVSVLLVPLRLWYFPPGVCELPRNCTCLVAFANWSLLDTRLGRSDARTLGLSDARISGASVPRLGCSDADARMLRFG